MLRYPCLAHVMSSLGDMQHLAEKKKKKKIGNKKMRPKKFGKNPYIGKTCCCCCFYFVCILSTSSFFSIIVEYWMDVEKYLKKFCYRVDIFCQTFLLDNIHS